MYRTVLSIVFLVAISHTCAPAIVIQTSKSEVLSRLYEATIDILTTCYAEPRSSAVGVVGDSDGSILKTLWSNNFIPAVVIDRRMKMNKSVTALNRHKLQVIVIAATSMEQFLSLMEELESTIWWNNEANYLILDPRPTMQCSKPQLNNLYILFKGFGAINAQVVCVDPTMNVWIFNSNPFTGRAPQPWQFVRVFRTRTGLFSVFKQLHQTCEALKFEKTVDIGGYPFYLVSRSTWLVRQITGKFNMSPPKPGSNIEAWVDYIMVRESRFVVDNIAIGLKASTLVRKDYNNITVSMTLDPWWVSAGIPQGNSHKVYSQVEYPLIAVTQHTGHMTQIEKILSVTDRWCLYGILVVYVITFLFFKFFMRLSAMPSVLNLVRLTSNMGLPALPGNLAPTIYLSCLLMFVVTFQGVYTGNLATLLTTTIPYPRVNAKRDIAKLNYKIYTYQNTYDRLREDPMIDGPMNVIPYETECTEYVMRDRLVVCILDYYKALFAAARRKLHLSKEAILKDYTLHLLTHNNPFTRRIQTIMRRWDEHGLRPSNEVLKILQGKLVDDDKVKKNTERRVMNFEDLRFAFVILGIGLTCASVCFIGEVVIYRISMKMAKRGKPVRRLLVREVTTKKF